MILFSNEPTTNWVLGQMFTKKYNFSFNNENKQILFYKKINNGNKNNESGKSHKLSKGALIAIISIVEALIFILAGIVLGKLIFGEKKKKTRVNELENEHQYKTKENNDISNTSNQNNLEKEKSIN